MGIESTPFQTLVDALSTELLSTVNSNDEQVICRNQWELLNQAWRDLQLQRRLDWWQSSAETRWRNRGLLLEMIRVSHDDNLRCRVSINIYKNDYITKQTILCMQMQVYCIEATALTSASASRNSDRDLYIPGRELT